MLIYDHPFYQLHLLEGPQVLEFQWKPAHTQMDYNQFKEACSNYAGWAFQYQTRRLLIDTRNFGISLPEDYTAYREEQHYPRFHALGVQKIAFLVPEEWLSTDGKEGAKNGTFIERSFADRTMAIEWLQADVSKTVAA